MNVNGSGLTTLTRKACERPLLNLASMVIVLAWLAFACYALSYLVSH